jgi:hypothetical protein
MTLGGSNPLVRIRARHYSFMMNEWHYREKGAKHLVFSTELYDILEKTLRPSYK